MNGDELAQIEYEELRHEVADSLSETRRLEIYAIGASAAFWAWTIADAPTATLASPTRWIPAVFTLLGGLRCIALLGHILDIRDYFLKIEAKFPRRLQFENHLMQQKRWFLVPVATLIWLALLVGNLYLASALPSYSHPEPPTTVCP